MPTNYSAMLHQRGTLIARVYHKNNLVYLKIIASCSTQREAKERAIALAEKNQASFITLSAHTLASWSANVNVKNLRHPRSDAGVRWTGRKKAAAVDRAKKARETRSQTVADFVKTHDDSSTRKK